jgi:flavin-dependent dehydrogenase
VDCLGALGILGRVREGGARVIDQLRLTSSGGSVGVPLRRWGLGFSRQRLDALAAREAGVLERHSVERVRSSDDGCGFLVEVGTPGGSPEAVAARVVVDAAGRSSRFTPGSAGGAFGVQFSEERDLGSVLEFGFFDWGYGGTVAVEGERANSCFLVRQAAIRRFLGRGDCRVTGPIAFDRRPGTYLAIGDAAGMVDPFSGEGMHHAFDSGEMAACAIAEGLGRGWRYATIRARYESDHEARWGAKRRVGRLLRWLVARPALRRSMRFPGATGMLLDAWWGVR